MASKEKTKGQHEEEMRKWAKANRCPTLAESLALIPHDGLTETQRKMLAAMSIPQIATLPAVRQAAYATVARHTWRENVNLSAFQDARAKFFREMLKEVVPKVTHAFVDGALYPSKANPAGNPFVQQRILEQTGILNPQNAPVNVTVGVEVRVEEQVKRRVGNVMERIGVSGETLEEILQADKVEVDGN